ncbi:MAG: hypothetical protein CMK07_07330 [Ponticaulis sp.]|nr:hypothetical protein [Ponticaulis sp.]
MIISFDLDQTIIPYADAFPVDRPSLLNRLRGAEPVRTGTRYLFDALRKRGHEVWIYTTSERSHERIDRTFRAAGCAVRRIINGPENRQKLASVGYAFSKCPPLFGIGLHIDDEEGVRMEADAHPYKCLIISPSDSEWIDTVLKAVDRH